jgi:hypothetical protein
MSYKKVKQDYKRVLDVIFKNNLEESLGPARCHEMAYLISKGMNKLGYKTEVQNGIYQDKFFRCPHSWVPCEGYVLSYFFKKHLDPMTMIFDLDEIARFFWQKQRYVPKKIDYSLLENIDIFAEKIFSQLK